MTSSESVSLSFVGCESTTTSLSAGDTTITLTEVGGGDFTDQTINDCIITATDAAGVTDDVTLTEFVIDTTAPTVTIQIFDDTQANFGTEITVMQAGVTAYLLLTFSEDIDVSTLDTTDIDISPAAYTLGGSFTTVTGNTVFEISWTPNANGASPLTYNL